MSIAQLIVALCKFLELEHHNVLDHRIEPPCAIVSSVVGGVVYNGFPGEKERKAGCVSGNDRKFIAIVDSTFRILFPRRSGACSRLEISRLLLIPKGLSQRETKFSMKIFAKPATRAE
jgi:hypothetical protein